MKGDEPGDAVGCRNVVVAVMVVILLTIVWLLFGAPRPDL